MSKHGQVNWIELITDDPEKAMAFYAATLGWSFIPETMPNGHTYWIAVSKDEPVGGIMDAETSYAPGEGDRWMLYLHVDDLKEAVERAEQNRATVLRPPWLVPGVGLVCILEEPGGAMVGWVTPVERPQTT